MIDVLIGVIPSVRKNQSNRDNPRRQAHKQNVAASRRKKKTDRRRGNRNGVVVTLSKYSDRRKRPDRGKTVYTANP